MEIDIRVLVSFKGHRKRMRLRSMIGDRATDYLIDLWLTARQDRPDGVLTGWDDLDVALASQYEGNATAYATALRECGFLDVLEDGTYKLHDWEDHQGWSCGAKRRSEAARVGARAKWDRRLKDKKQDVMRPHKNRIAVAERSDCARYAPSPSPSPSPSPKPKNKNHSGLKTPFVLPDFIDPQIWTAYLEMRKVKKKPATEKAIELVLEKLEKFKAKGMDPNQSLKDSIESSWTGVFEPKPPGGNGTGQKTYGSPVESVDEFCEDLKRQRAEIAAGRIV